MAKKKAVKKTSEKKAVEKDLYEDLAIKIIETNHRIDRLVDAISKSKNVKGI